MQRTAVYLVMLFLAIAPRALAQEDASIPAVFASLVSEAEDVAPEDSVSITTEVTTLSQLVTTIAAKQRASHTIGVTKGRRPVTVHYFPGRSDKRALVIGGVHGTELASIEVANQLVQQLAAGDTPFYNVLIIPSLFPDNAALALEQISELGSSKNLGRYTHAEAADPNRQMPRLGKPYDAATNTDALGRPVEYENGILLQLIQAYQPQRIVNIHAIRDTTQGGVYADPRTDTAGYALAFASDSSLAVDMARFIEAAGGNAHGNHIESAPTALYYKDPPAVAPGQWQPRSCYGALLPGERGHGVSLGSWASTAVFDSVNTAHNRPAMRLLTMEFPGYKRPQDYSLPQQPYYTKQVILYAAAIQQFFLEDVFVEE